MTVMTVISRKTDGCGLDEDSDDESEVNFAGNDFDNDDHDGDDDDGHGVNDYGDDDESVYMYQNDGKCDRPS